MFVFLTLGFFISTSVEPVHYFIAIFVKKTCNSSSYEKNNPFFFHSSWAINIQFTNDIPHKGNKF